MIMIINKNFYALLFLLFINAGGYSKANNFAAGEATDPPVATIFKIDEDTLWARPERGFKIRHLWQGDSIIKKYKVWFQLVNSNGETVMEDPHFPPVPTYAWDGDVSYERLVTLPVWKISNNRTVNVTLPEGEYDIVAGLYDENNTNLLELNTGPGVTEYKTGLYRIGVLVLDSLAPVPGPGEPTLDLNGYRLTFDEEFDTLSVSAWGPAGEGGSTWIAHTPWYGDFGDADFVSPAQGFPFTVNDGILRIEAAMKNGEWQSGLLSAVDPNGKGFKQQFGYFECRAKLPAGPGVWPAFWLMGTKNRWATGPRVNPEVDILEQYGHWPNRFSFALHLWGLGGMSSIHEGEKIEVLGMQDDFHTYGMLIEADSMILYFDGVEMYRRKTPEELHTPLYPLVNLALGPGWPLDKTPDPSYMYVDYVKIYDRYLRSDDLEINWNKKLIHVPWGIYRDSLLFHLDYSADLEIEYKFSPEPEDSLHQIVRNGDTIFLKEEGASSQTGFGISVKDPASDNAKVYSLNIPNEENEKKYQPAFSVRESGANTGNISDIPYGTTDSILMRYLEKAPDAHWEINWSDEYSRNRLISGDILKVTAADGVTKRQ